METTIAAVSTPIGTGGISIIRLSGADAFKIAAKIFNPEIITQSDRTIKYYQLFHDNNFIDEVLVTKMQSPKTYTGEDIVEINCHGGLQITNQIYDLIIRAGAIAAKPGEFTQRSFLNGKKNLIEATAVMDIIAAKNKQALKFAQNTLVGKTTSKIKEIHQLLLEIITQIEVNIDYPEYQTETEMIDQEIKNRLTKAQEKLTKIILTSEEGLLLSEGINTVIIGMPNAGKSTLINKLSHSDVSIVTDVPGTTRDLIKAQVNFDGIILNLIDTAGIRTSHDPVEQIGINKTIQAVANADLVLHIIEYPNYHPDQNLKLAKTFQNIPTITILNKIDLATNPLAYEPDQILVSLAKNQNLNSIKKAITAIFFEKNLSKTDSIGLTNITQINQLKQVNRKISESLKLCHNQVEVDIIELEVKAALFEISDLLGLNPRENLINEIFENFCLGK